MTNIVHIDISGCTSIEADVFMDCIIYVMQLKRFIMIPHHQFTEADLVSGISRLKTIKYLDMGKCPELAFSSVVWIILNLPCVEKINFDPKNPQGDVEDWRIVLINLRSVHFGHNVRVCMPYYANHWRVPLDEEEETTTE